MRNPIQNISITIFAGTLFLTIGLLPAFGQSKKPPMVADFFKIIPPGYFSIFCCDENKDEYLKKYVTVNDAKNGFMEGGDYEEDPQSQGFVLKIFPARNGRQILGLYSHSIRWEDYYFLEYKNGKLVNISGTIPNYSQDNIYDFPRTGETVKVYKKKFSSPSKEINADETVERGKYLYSLNWLGGKFIVGQ